MSEFREARRRTVAESTLAIGMISGTAIEIAYGDLLGFVLGTIGSFFQLIIVAMGVGRVRGARARLDLREAYPPRRDGLHRDLERLNRLRGEAASVERLDERVTVRKRVDDPAIVLKHHRERLEGEWLAAQRKSQRRSDAVDRTYAVILEDIRDVLLFMAPLLVVVLLGAVIGLAVSLL